MSRLSSIIALTVMALGCSSADEPTPYVGYSTGVPILVTNGSCVGGSCAPLRILAFPSVTTSTPGGLWSLDLGVITTQQACLYIPAAAHFYVIGQEMNGSADTTVITWTSAVPVALSAQPPSMTRFTSSPTTAEFIPDQAAGWRTTLPAGTHVDQGSACTP